MRAHKRRPSSSSSHQDPFPPEIWREILARVPAKTLIKFRSVCKSWCSLIDSPDFNSMHIKIYPNNSQKIHLLVLERLFLTCGATALVYKILHRNTLRKITQLNTKSHFQMVDDSDMVNGLMLMENVCFLTRFFCLWNPSIKKSLVLPAFPLTFISGQGRCFLGYAPSSGDYKVVGFPAVDESTGNLSMAVYSLFDRIWRVKTDNVNVPSWCYRKLRSGCGVLYFQGAVYWRPMGIEEETRLVCFEFDDEKFGVVELPSAGVNMLKFLFLLGDSLAVFGVSLEKSCIWVMEKDAKKMQWRIYFQGDSNSDVYEIFAGFANYPVKILYVEKSGNFLVASDGKMMSYNVASCDFRIHRIEHLGKPVHCLYLDICVDSLALGVEPKNPTSLA